MTFKHIPTTVTNVNHSATICCFDVVKLFEQPTDGILTECGKEWNCNLECPSDCPYNMPFPLGETLMIQTILSDPGTVSICDENGIVSSDLSAFTSRYLIGTCEPKGNIQNYELDSDKIAALGLKCFTIHIETEDFPDGLCSQTYEIVEDSCDNYVCLEGVRSGRDCDGCCYDLATEVIEGENFEYSNKIYIWGESGYYGIDPSGLEDDDPLREYCKVYPSRKYPKYIARHIGMKIMDNVSFNLVDGEVMYSDTPRFNIIEGSSMFLDQIEFYKECSTGTC